MSLKFKIAVCPICKNEFLKKKTEQIYCSMTCFRKSGNIRNQSTGSKKHTCICKNCGKEYMPKDMQRISYCSRECYFESKGKRKDRNKSLRTVISLLKKLINLKKKELNKPYSTKHICPECGIEFIGHKSAKYCSKKCCRRAVKRERRHIERSGSIHNSNPITIQLLGERDHWICGICGKKINPKAAHDYIENGASVDHIIPLSCGGQHNWSNVQIAHFNCNSKRSNTPIVKQLYLDFGGIN